MKATCRSNPSFCKAVLEGCPQAFGAESDFSEAKVSILLVALVTVLVQLQTT